MEKKDNIPIWQKHKDILSEKGVDFDKIIEIRKDIHKHPETAFKELETRQKIIDFLWDIEPENIKTWAETGIIVDIKGTGPESSEGECSCIAYRADMDALPMAEETGLEYQSVTDWAHMCGHDGHIATLLATAQFWIAHRSRIPKNKTIRLLFQPAEEGPGGAEPMVKEGCMEDVDEVYGYHNAPLGQEGSVSVWKNEFMAGVVIVKIEIEGKGGHGSEPAKSIDPITAACNLHSALHTIKSRNLMNTDTCAFTLTKFQSGTTFNVIPRTASLAGTIRYYQPEVRDLMQDRIKTLTEGICEAFGCKGTAEFIQMYPSILNSDKQTQIFIDIATQELGEQRVNQTEGLPWFTSEDFSYFLLEKPGCFVALNNIKPGVEPVSLHSSSMDFNDNIISTGAYLNIKLSEHRLGLNLL